MPDSPRLTNLNLAQQAAERIKLARNIGATPWRWVATDAAEVLLIAEAPADAWGNDWETLYGIPIERGAARSEWGLDLVLAPRMR